MLAQGCAKVYQACRGVGVLVCIQSASRNEERLSSYMFKIGGWLDLHKANNLQGLSGHLDSSGKEFLTPRGSSAPNGSLEQNKVA